MLLAVKFEVEGKEKEVGISLWKAILMGLDFIP